VVSINVTGKKAPASPSPSTSTDTAEGLAPNSISLPGVLFVAIATMAPGAGAAYAIVSGAPFAGGSLPLAVVVALVGSMLVATAIGQLAKHMTSAGGLASYVGKSMHNSLAFVVAWAYPFVYLCALPYLALVFGNLLATSVDPNGSGTGHTLIWVAGALVCLGISGAMNFFGAEFGARLGLILGLFEILVLGVMSVWMIFSAGDRNTASVFTTHHATVAGFTGSSGIVAASVYGFLAFIGFEAGAPLAEETKNPKKNIPRAVIGSALLVGLFFVLTTYASTVFFGPNKMSNFLTYNGGNAWIGLAKTLWGGGWVILLIALLNSALACSNGAAMAATRSIWAMGHSGTLPHIFAHTHKRWRSPVVAIGTLFGVATVATLAFGLLWDPVTAYAFFGTVLTITVLPIYFLTSLACPLYFWRFRRSEMKLWLHVVIPILGAAFLVPAFCAGAGIHAFSFVASLAWPLNLAGPVTAVWYLLGIGGAVYLYKRKRSSLDQLSASVTDRETPAAPRTIRLPEPAREAVLE
jgi:amino acid transporter